MMKQWGIQVKVLVREPNQPARKEWRDVHPSGGEPYRYDTRSEAEQIARMCYGNPSSKADWRVTEINERKAA